MLARDIALYKQPQRRIDKGIELPKTILPSLGRTQEVLEYLLLPSPEVEGVFEISLLELKGNLIHQLHIHRKGIEALDMYLYKVLIAIGEPLWQYPLGFNPFFSGENQKKIQKTHQSKYIQSPLRYGSEPHPKEREGIESHKAEQPDEKACM
jgi:hypothetical protein